MKDISTTETTAEDQDRKKLVNFRSYILNPIKGGIFGFATFFTLLLGIKYFSYFIGSQPKFYVDITDVILSLLGFLLVFLIKFLENFQEKETDI
ncbi:MAG: hypothetical protein ACM3S2_07565 [Ignavibacteriales bacterium]